MTEIDKLVIYQRCPVCARMVNKVAMVPITIFWSKLVQNIVALACGPCGQEPVHTKRELR